MYIWHRDGEETQTEDARSYIGGLPLLPKGFSVPKYDKTATDMTFFFQIELPDHHKWAGHIVSVFAVMDYTEERDFSIPKLPSPLARAALNAKFFEDYQTFFRFFVFRAVDLVMAEGYVRKVPFRKLFVADRMPGSSVEFGRIATNPEWILDDETPGSFDGRSDVIHFLFQTKEGYEFSTVDGAPRQQEPTYTGEGSGMEDSLTSEYSLFVSNVLYFFGIDAKEKLIYVIPQS